MRTGNFQGWIARAREGVSLPYGGYVIYYLGRNVP